MKRSVITLLGTLLLTILLNYSYAQVPQAFNYQAIARNSSGNLLTNQAIGIKINIHQTFANGTIVYAETFTPITNQYGLFTLSIGQGLPTTGTFSAILWNTGNYWLQVQMDPAGGSSYTDMGTSQLLSVPYAITAGNSFWAGNGNNISNTNSGSVGIGTSVPAASTALDISSTNGALLLPRLTTLQRNALTPSAGMIIYNTNKSKFQGYVIGTNAPDQSDSVFSGGSGGDRAQSFTAGFSGTLNSIELALGYPSTPYTLTIEIHDGAGTSGSVLSTQQFTLTDIPLQWYSFTITGVNVIAGHIYTIHVTPATICFSGNCYTWGMDTNGSYIGGNYYENGLIYTPPADCMFVTHVTPATGWVDLH